MQASDTDFLATYRVSPVLGGCTREKVTSVLSDELVAKVLWPTWAAEVVVPGGGRVDFVDFRPKGDMREATAGTVEAGTFRFFEVKSCLDDFHSGHGLNFFGDEDWLVCPVELFDELRLRQELPDAGVLAYGADRSGRRRFVRLGREQLGKARRDPASLLLYQMARAGIGR